MNLHPAVTFAGIISAALVFGFLGVLLITPTIASVRTLVTYIVRKLRDQEPFESSYTQSDVRIPGLIAGHRIQAIIFDLDGVLTELDFGLADQIAQRLGWSERVWPLEARRKVFRRLLHKMEGPIHWWIGMLLWVQLYDDLERMAGFLNRARAFPPAQQLNARPGVADFLRELSHSYHLGLLTSRPRPDVDCFLERAGLPSTLFSSLTAQDNPRSATSPSEALALAVKEMGVTPDQVLMVGDSEWKLRPAQASGAVRCGVLGGLAVASDFADADLLLDNFAELRTWL